MWAVTYVVTYFATYVVTFNVTYVKTYVVMYVVLSPLAVKCYDPIARTGGGSRLYDNVNSLNLV